MENIKHSNSQKFETFKVMHIYANLQLLAALLTLCYHKALKD